MYCLVTSDTESEQRGFAAKLSIQDAVVDLLEEDVRACCVGDAGMRPVGRLVTTQSPTTRLPQSSAASCLPGFNTDLLLIANLRVYTAVRLILTQVNCEKEDASFDQLTIDSSSLFREHLTPQSTYTLTKGNLDSSQGHRRLQCPRRSGKDDGKRHGHGVDKGNRDQRSSTCALSRRSGAGAGAG